MQLSDNNIFSFSLEKFQEYLPTINLKKYRCNQIVDWIYKKNVYSFDLMSNISMQDCYILKQNISTRFLDNCYKLVSADSTVKYVFKLFDGQLIETVLMQNKYGYSLCVSTQVGCNMGCKFCYSGLLKKKRNLFIFEMVQQIILVQLDLNIRLNNIVLMGIGEPFDNYDNVLDFLKIVNNDLLLGIGARHITVSTCGLVNRIYDFCHSNLNVNLAISLHSVFQNKRQQIMPIAEENTLELLNKAIFYYLSCINNSRKKITLEYIMIDNFNDKDEDIEQIIKYYKNKQVYINLIPLNGNLNSAYAPSSPERIEYFFTKLIKSGIQTIIRKTQGDDIMAACGQLRATKLKEKLSKEEL